MAPKDRGPVPQRSKTAEERVVAADRFLVDRYDYITLGDTVEERLQNILAN